MTDSRRLRAVLVVLLIFCLQPLTYAEGLPRYFKLIILHTNDVHGHILPFDYSGERNVGGVARRGTMINNIRANAGCPVIVMDAGDIFQRGPLARIYMGKPDFEAMNTIPYDIITLGNNEFKGTEGLDSQQILRERIKQARFPVVCANVIEENTGKHLVPPYTVLNVDGIRIGIFGLTAPRVAEYPQAKGFRILNPIETAKKLLPELKQKSDVVIALSHIGYGLDLVLAAEVPEIDVIVGGDSHTWLEEPVLVPLSDTMHPFWVGGPIIVQDGEWGKCLGRLDLYLRLSGEHDYQVMSYNGKLLPVDASVADDTKVNKVLEPYIRPYRKVIGRLEQPITPEQAPLWTAEVIRKATGADIGAFNSVGTTAGLYAGQVTMLDLLGIYPFDNGVVTVKLTGEQLSDFLAKIKPAVAGVDNIEPEKVYVLATEDYLLSSWEAGSGIEAKPVGKRVTEIVTQFLETAL